MDGVRDVRAARDVTARRASSVAAVFSRLGEGVPLPLVARELARLDVPVFPCAPGGKRPIPERGFHEATTDAGQVDAWWRRRPGASLAVPTGTASGVVVVDIDVHKVDGYTAFGRAARSGFLSEPLAVVTTGAKRYARPRSSRSHFRASLRDCVQGARRSSAGHA